jgi:hypothetical protein
MIGEWMTDVYYEGDMGIDYNASNGLAEAFRDWREWVTNSEMAEQPKPPHPCICLAYWMALQCAHM